MGLAQRQIEAAGFSTISLSNIHELTAATGVPRLAAIEHPFGQLLGEPGDESRQTAVLRDTLEALEGIQEPGTVIHLPYQFAGSPRDKSFHPPQPPPIALHLRDHPWHLPNLISRNIPEKNRDNL